MTKTVEIHRKCLSDDTESGLNTPPALAVVICAVTLIIFYTIFISKLFIYQ